MRLKIIRSSTMAASTSTSAKAKRLSSPPPPSSKQPLPPPETSLRDPFEPDINLPQRNYLNERVTKRRRIEEHQDQSLIHGFELRQYAAKFLECDDFSSLQEAIDEYSKSKNESLLRIFTSLTRYYPNAFSLKLAKMLQLHPPLEIRIGIVDLLLQTLPEGLNRPLHCSIVCEIKQPLLHSLMLESEEFMFTLLCEAIGLLADRLFRTFIGGWNELLVSIVACIVDESISNKKKGLLMLTELPVNVDQNNVFWLNQGNFDLVLGNILQLVNSMDMELKRLAYNATLSLMLLSKDLQITDVCKFLLPVSLNIIDQHGDEEILENRIKRLGDLVTLDNESIVIGNEENVFWCMIRVAEANDLGEEVRSEAIGVIDELDTADKDTMEGVLWNLSYDEVGRVISVAMNMMSSIVDDPVWYDVDSKHCPDAGLTDAFYRGQFLFNLLCEDGNRSVVIPTAIGMIAMNYASNASWEIRQAAMLAIASMADKSLKHMHNIQYFVQVATLVLKSLDDPNIRVVWAAVHAIRRLSDCKEAFLRAQYHKKFLPKMIPIIRCNKCARVQSYAVIVIRSLIKDFGLDIMSSFGEQIVASLLEFLKHEKQKLHGEAFDTLKSIALSMPRNFHQNYYDTTMEALKVIAFDKNGSPNLMLCAKCLELMVVLVRDVGPDDFKEQEAVQVVESIISLKGKLSETENLTKSIISKALDQFCRCPRMSIDKFINKIMPMLLEFAQPCPDILLDQPTDNSITDDDKRLVETISARACATLSYCAVRSFINFSPHHVKVTPMFIRLLGSPSFEIRKACLSGLPNLLLSIVVGDTNNSTKSNMTFILVKSVIEVLSKGDDRDFATEVLRILTRCIQVSSSFFNNELIQIITDQINQTIKEIIKTEIEKAKKMGLPELRATGDTMKAMVHLIETAVDTFKDKFMLHIVDDLISNVVVFLAEGKPDRVIAFAISIFNVIFPLYPDKLPPYFDKYNLISGLVLEKNYTWSQLHATRAIGICAMFGGDLFKASVNASISRLYSVISRRLVFAELFQNGDPSTIFDTAIAALGKICEFHRDRIGPTVVEKWLGCLPLKCDYNEARYAHGLLSKLIQRSDEYLFGSNDKHLPKVISVVKKILAGPERLGTEEDINKMIGFIDRNIDFIDRHCGMEIGTGKASSSLPISTRRTFF